MTQSQIAPWAANVRSVVADLESLNRTTESDFLAVGGNLMTFLTASRGLHGEIAGLTALVSGEQAQHACDALDSVHCFVEKMQRGLEEVGRALQTLHSGADRIRQGFSTFGKIASSFRITATLARIEAARLSTSAQNLKSLADDVRSCSDGIRARADTVVQVATGFDSRVASALLEISRFEALQQRELPTVLTEVDADVDVFRTRQKDTAQASSKLADELDSVARDLGKVAISIQFHDITRQQLEHVIEALASLLTDAAEKPVSFRMGRVAKLQRAQLQNAAKSFAQSTEKIENDLGVIASRVREMANSSNCVQGVDHEDRDSFFAGMQQRFAGIQRAVQELHSQECETRAIVAGLETNTGGMRRAVDEVQSIESQLRLISINAVASAIRIGIEGNGLKVIAAAIGDLRMESESRSRGAEEALDSIAGAIGSLANAGDAESSDNSSAKLIEDLNARMRELQLVSASGSDAAASIAAQADSLCANLQDARERFSIGGLFGATIDRCCDSLDRITAQAELAPPDAEFAAEDHRERYTMETERNVHRDFGGEPPHLPAEHSQSLGSDEEVEFF